MGRYKALLEARNYVSSSWYNILTPVYEWYRIEKTCFGYGEEASSTRTNCSGPQNDRRWGFDNWYRRRTFPARYG